MPGQVVSSILNCLQWYVARFYVGKSGLRKRSAVSSHEPQSVIELVNYVTLICLLGGGLRSCAQALAQLML